MRAIIFLLAGLLSIGSAASAAYSAASAASASTEKKVVCYLGTWAVYRPGNGKFDISDIDPTLCTHLIYAFVGLGDNATVKSLDPNVDLPEGKDGFARFAALREKSASTKIIAAMGGWNEGSVKYSNLAADADLRKKFVENVVEFVKKYKFDGFDLDWEYPAQRDGIAADKENFVLLLQQLRQRFDKEGLLLSAAVASAESSASLSYDIPKVAEQLHFINLMTYDLHGSWDGKTGINAPTYGTDKLNDDAIITYWLEQGAPPEKLNLGVPFYGRGYTLADNQTNGIGATTTGPSLAGPYTREAGTLGYNEICEKFKNETWTVKYDEQQQVPYAFSGNQWVGYDDKRSLTAKTQLMLKRNLGGIMVWSIETDDFRGICGDKYPLLNTIKNVINNGGGKSAAVQSGGESAAVQSGDKSAAAQSGDKSAAAQSGDKSAAAQSGGEAAPAQSGGEAAPAQSGGEAAPA